MPRKTDPLPALLPRPVFFLSYARQRQFGMPAKDVNDSVQAMFSELTTNVAVLVGSPTGEDPGFMDTHTETGTQWQAELADKVCSCHVFVALLSVAYMRTSEWCAMEWDLFMKRTATRVVDGRERKIPPVIPVLWAPVPPGRPTEIAAVEEFQALDLRDDIRARYRENGVFGLYQTDQEAYKAVVWSLSKEISRLYHKYTVEPMAVPDISRLRRQFANPRDQRT